MTKFAQFKLGHSYYKHRVVFADEDGLFDIRPTKKKINANNAAFGTGYPYVARGERNNGIRGSIQAKTEYLNPENTISFGQDTATMYYQDRPYFTGDKIQVFHLNSKYGELSRDIALFLIAATKKAFALYGWGKGSYAVDSIANLKVWLPVDNSGYPDFSYMANWIQKLEAERVKELVEDRNRELEAYLTTAGLSNYKLSEAENDTLKLTKPAKTFLLGDLFDFQVGDVDLQQRDIDGEGTDFINSGLANLGIKGKTSVHAKVFPADTITIDFWGNAFYRDVPYKLATHNHVFSLSGDVIKNQLVGLYLVGLMRKFPLLYGYSNMATRSKLSKLKIRVPVDSTGAIDYAYMENYIKAVEKLSIKSVVDYKDQVIQATREVVGGNRFPN